MAEHPHLHPVASAGFSCGAEIYVRGRPGYPEALLGWLRDVLQLRAGRTAVDLGAGTGKFTALLTRTGADIVAIEPVTAMRLRLSGSASSSVIAAVAQAIPLQGGVADALVCAQAFHWFATAAVLLEMHRVLRAGGLLGLVWNVRDETVDWVAAINAILAPYEADAPRFTSGRWREAFAQPGARGLFSEPQFATWRYESVGPPQQVIVERFLSVSFIAALPADERACVKQRLQNLIDTHPQLRGRAQVAFPYMTHAYGYPVL